jgi:hypothetical protein
MISTEQNKVVWVVPIEPIDQRYTKQWFEEIPLLLRERGSYQVEQIEGQPLASKTTKGAFLDFAMTNIYKSSQLIKIAELFNEGIIKENDRFLFTDAWNPVILQVRYMSDLLDIPVEIHGIWHAGHYDSTDILGIKMIGDWPYYLEKSLYKAIDFSYFATEFHRSMFMNSFDISSTIYSSRKLKLSGQPHNQIVRHIESIPSLEKKNEVVWPHRYNSDKNPQIIEELIPILESKGISVVITQKQNLSKDEYYRVLKEAKMVFSCASHENLGISIMEGVLADCIPLVPNSSSYQEMYYDIFKYQSIHQNLDKTANMIIDMVYNYDKYKYFIDQQKNILKEQYLNANPMLNNVMR